MNTLNLEAKQYTSRVLADWAASRPGAAGRISNAQVVTAVSSDNDAMNALFQPITAASGFAVTDKTAMLVSTVYACLSKLAGAVLQLPVRHYRYDAAGERERVNSAPLWWLLNEQPHALWTSASWKEWIVRCVALRGDQHTRILRSSNNTGGQITGLQPLHPDLVVPRLVADKSGHRVVYDIVDAFSAKVETVDQDDMLHFASFGFDGLRSLSAIQTAAKQGIGNSLASAEFTGRTIGEGAMPQIALEFANKMTPEQAKQLRDSFVATYTGHGARKLPLVLTEGGKVSELSISPVDLQLIESRRYEKEDICQALGVPPIIIGDSDKASSWGTGIEQITLGFVKFTIAPMLCRWEEELNRKLFRNAGQFVEFELDGLLRGDSKAQSEVFKAALGGPGTGDGYMTVNEVRRLKNMPRIDGGDELFKAQRGTTTPPPAGTPK
ncbi:MAG: phage portal protein [Burkholderiaceae bacterium]|nr:phage portal protein [Burkholderiaceae bacterium]